MRASIVLVEDRTEARSRYEQVLKDFNFEVLACSGLTDAEEALKSANRVDGLWVDINLVGPPEDYRNASVVDGLDLIQAANGVSQGIPTLVCSAYITEDAKEKSQRLHIFDRIAAWHSKPVDAELVGFDMVRVVNIAYWRRKVLPEVQKEFVGKSAELLTAGRNVIRTANPYKLFSMDPKEFERKLIGKMAELFSDLEQRARQGDHESAWSYQSWAFKLTADHVPTCFETAGRNHQALAEHLLHVTETFDRQPLLPDAACQLRRATEGLGRQDLTEDTVYEIKRSLRQTLGAPVGPVLGSTREELLRHLFGDNGKEH